MLEHRSAFAPMDVDDDDDDDDGAYPTIQVSYANYEPETRTFIITYIQPVIFTVIATPGMTPSLIPSYLLTPPGP